MDPLDISDIIQKNQMHIQHENIYLLDKFINSVI